jgi:hypothetical protein
VRACVCACVPPSGFLSAQEGREARHCSTIVVSHVIRVVVVHENDSPWKHVFAEVPPRQHTTACSKEKCAGRTTRLAIAILMGGTHEGGPSRRYGPSTNERPCAAGDQCTTRRSTASSGPAVASQLTAMKGWGVVHGAPIPWVARVRADSADTVAARADQWAPSTNAITEARAGRKFPTQGTLY